MKNKAAVSLANLFKTLFSIVKILILSKPTGRLPAKFKNSSCVILGNGPSLKEKLKEKDLFKGKFVLCLNYFPVHDDYETVKPDVIVLQAPEFWLMDIRTKYYEDRENLFEQIVKKTSWDVSLFIPTKFKRNKEFHNKILKNKNITISYFNDTPIDGFQYFKKQCFGLGLGMPRPHNVIIPSIMVMMRVGCKELFLVGVDHSWLPEISVNEKNETLLRQQHFYDKDQVDKKVMYKLGRRPRMLHEVLEKFMFTFRSYVEIRKYADSKGVKIYNLTKGSYIDAFERK